MLFSWMFTISINKDVGVNDTFDSFHTRSHKTIGSTLVPPPLDVHTNKLAIYENKKSNLVYFHLS